MSDSLELELQAVVGNLATGSGCRGRKWGPLEEQQGLLMADPTTSIFEIGSRAYLELINLARLNNYPEISRVLCLPALGLQACAAVSDFYKGARDQNSGPYACTASTLPSKPSPSLLPLFYKT